MSFGGEKIFGTPLSLGQFGYMAEAEGQDDLVDTFDARFNAAINDMRTELAWAKDYDDLDVTSEVNEILERHGINPQELKQHHINRIANNIS